MHRYSANPWKLALTELEVFVGNVIGKEQRVGKRQREASKGMQEGMSHTHLVWRSDILKHW